MDQIQDVKDSYIGQGRKLPELMCYQGLLKWQRVVSNAVLLTGQYELHLHLDGNQKNASFFFLAKKEIAVQTSSVFKTWKPY